MEKTNGISKSKKVIYTVGIYCLFFISAVCTTTQGVLLTDFIEYYGLESYQQGLVSAAQSVGNLIALFVVGLLLAKLAKKYVILIVAIVIPVVFILFGMTPPFALFLFGYFIYGAVFGFLDSLASSMMVDLYPDKSNVFMNLLHATYGIGGLCGPIFLRILRSKNLVWNKMLIVTGCFALVAAAIYIIATLITRDMKTGVSGGQEKITLSDMAGFLKQRKKLFLLIAAFTYGAHQTGITVWMTRYISEYLGAPNLGAYAVSMFWGTVFLSRLILPQVKLDKILQLVIYNLVSCVAITVGVLSGNPVVMMIGIGVSGFAEGTILPMELDIACHWEIERTSLGSSIILISHYIGFIVTPILIGYLVNAINVTVGIMVTSVFSIIGALFMFIIYGMNKKETVGK